MDEVISARVLMGDSLGFHIIFALLGVGLPLVVGILEYLAIRRRDAELRRIAQFWSYVAGILVIAGVISGTVVALQMFLVWPGILQFGGQAIGLAFSWEGYAFIMEAIFLGYYLKTWNSNRGWSHLVLLIPVVLGAALSAFVITSVSAWMSHPSGITVLDGRVVAADPIAAIFTATTYLKAGHSMLSYYLTAILLVAGSLALRLLSGRARGAAVSSVRLAIGRLSVIALLVFGGIAVLGDASAKYLAAHEPTKLAAMELHGQTGSNAAFNFGGVPASDGSAEGGIQIPGLLSFLVGGNTNTVVKGLSEVPADQWPPLVIHTLFDIKLVLIGALSVVLLYVVYRYLRRGQDNLPSVALIALASTPVLSLIILELGWMITEIGRQPYAVYGHVLTKDAFTTSPGVIGLGWLFPFAYLLLAAVTIGAIWRLTQSFPAQPKGGIK